MKQATLILALLGAVLLAGCGGGTSACSGSGSSNGDTTSTTTCNNGSGSQPFKPTTHLLHRSIVSNYFAGDLAVIDATQDRLTTFTFAAGAQPTYMQPSPDGTLTFVNNVGSGSISSLNNYLEAVKANIQLGGTTQSFVTSADNKFGFAAVPNYNNGLPPNLPGAINRFNPTDGSLNTAIPFPYVHYLAIDPAQKHLLAFTSGDVSAVNGDNNAYWVDLNATDTAGFPSITLLAPPSGAFLAGTFSKPIAAFFSADSTKAFILNCGTECGGTTAASVTEIAPTFNSTTQTWTATVVKQWPVRGARSGLIDLTANKLYVAGSTDSGGNNVQDGYFTVIDLSAGTASSPIRIGNGVKGVIRNNNGNFWVASTNCGAQSCITLVNPSAGTAAILPDANGGATGISVQVNSGEIYTIEGAQLHIYDRNGNPITSQYSTDVKGQPWDVLYIN